MDDFNNNPFGFEEIDQIQKAIDEDLKKSNPAPEPVRSPGPAPEGATLDSGTETPGFIPGPGLDAEQSTLDNLENAPAHSGDYIDGPSGPFPGETPTAAGDSLDPAYGTRIVTDTVAAPSYAAGTGCSQPAGDSFFKETIKNESVKNGSGRFKKILIIAAVVSVAGGLFAGLGISIGSAVIKQLRPVNSANSETITPTEPAQDFSFADTGESRQPVTRTSGSTIGGYPNFADIVDMVEPSVVNITSRVNVVSQRSYFNITPSEYEVPYSGSGIIFDQDDEKVFIVTNNHVIEDGNSISVSVMQSEEVIAKVVGTNPESDLAVLSVLKSDLREKDINSVVVAAFGNSADMRVGDLVIAIGNALGEGNTATFGMVSANNKEINVYDKVLTVIQTDAAINPGNSGGPLVNLDGQVIGINTVKLTETSIEGMGYSITSDVAMPIIEELRNEVTKPFLGVACYDVTSDIARIYDLPQLGVIVETVIEGSSADDAGIRVNDIITSFNGQTVYSMAQLSEDIQNCNIGDRIEVKLIRNGDLKTLTVTLKERN